MDEFFNAHGYTCGLVEIYDAMIDRVSKTLIEQNIINNIEPNVEDIDKIVRKRGYLQCKFKLDATTRLSLPIPTGSKYSATKAQIDGYFIIRGLSYAFVSMNEILPNYPIVSKIGNNIECKYRYYDNGYTYSLKVVSKDDDITIIYDNFTFKFAEFFISLSNYTNVNYLDLLTMFNMSVNHMSKKLTKHSNGIIIAIRSIQKDNDKKNDLENDEKQKVARFELLGTPFHVANILAIMLVRLFDAKYTNKFDDIDDEVFIRAEWASMTVETMINRAIFDKTGKVKEKFENGLYELTDKILSMFILNKAKNRKFQDKIGVTQELEQLTPIDALSHIRRLKVYMSEDQAPDRKREYNAKQYGYMCMFETSDSKAAGLNKAIACTALISRNEHEYSVINQPDLEYLITMDCEGNYPLFENGRFIGYVLDYKEFIRIVYEMKIEKDLMISAYLMNNIFCYNNDEGRLVRPLIHKDYNHCMYMDIGEYHTQSTDEFCSIAPLGLSAAMITFANMSPGPRNAYQCSMNKQVISFNKHKLTSTNHQEKILCNPSMPFVATEFTMKYLNDFQDFRHSNIVVIIMPDKSNNEDALIVNAASVQRGLFNNTKIITERIFKHGVSSSDPKEVEQLKTTKDSVKKFIRLNFSMDDNEEFVYDENGTVKVGTVLKNKMDMQQSLDLRKINPQQTHKYVSLHESTVFETRYHDDQFDPYLDYTEVKSSHFRKSDVGDKHATDAAQKGVIALLRNDWEMMQLPDGTIPDIQINPHGLPSRMTVGTLLNLLIGSYMFSTNKLHPKIKERMFKSDKYQNLSTYVPTNDTFYCVNATPFIDNEDMKKILKDADCHKARMFNPITGMWTATPVAYGVLPYVSLKQQICEKSAARLTGPIIEMTGQPIKGRKKDGGSALGEMEVNAFIGYSASNILHQRLFVQTDSTVMRYCALCKHINLVESTCNTCFNDTIPMNIRKPFLTYANIMASMGFDVYCGP